MVSARVLVSDAEIPAALAVTRSLGRAGHRVAVLAHDPHAPAAASRHCRRVVRVPDPGRDADGFTEALVRAAARGRFDVFLPVTDGAALLAAAARDRLRVRVAMPAPPALEAALTKTEVLDRAEALGIPVLPRFRGDGLRAAPIPAVVKPVRSRIVADGALRGATARVVGDSEALLGEAASLEAAGFGAYAEPWVPGEARGVFLFMWKGRALARFAHRRVREASPLGGPSAVCESVPADPALLARAEALARELGLDGPLMAEFRGDVLLEVNARYWGSLALAIAAGVDFPALHVAALLGDPVRGPAEWRTGVRARSLAFDVRHAARALRGRPAGLDIPWPGRARSLAGLVTERAAGMVFERGDPAPGRAHFVSLLRKAVVHA